MAFSPFDGRVLRTSAISIDTSAGTGLVGGFQAGENGGMVIAMLATNDDVIDHDVYVQVSTASGPTFLGSATVPAGQGTAGTPAKDLIAACLPASMVNFLVGSGQQVVAKVSVAMGGVAALTVSTFGFDF